METKPTPKAVIILSETTMQSLIEDLGTFFMFAGLMAFNHKILAGNILLDLLFIIIVILFLKGKSSSRVYEGNREGAVEWLQRKDTL